MYTLEKDFCKEKHSFVLGHFRGTCHVKWHSSLQSTSEENATSLENGIRLCR